MTYHLGSVDTDRRAELYGDTRATRNPQPRPPRAGDGAGIARDGVVRRRSLVRLRPGHTARSAAMPLAPAYR